MQDAPPTADISEGAAAGEAQEPVPVLPQDLRGQLSLGLISLGSVLLLLFVFRMLWRRPRATAAPSEAAPRPAAAASARANERLEQLMVDAEELTRRLAAILDNKAARLEALLEQTEERLRELNAASREARPPPARSAPAPEPPRDDVDPLHRRVYELADQGLTPVDIARKTDRPTGQVELILALRRT